VPLPTSSVIAWLRSLGWDFDQEIGCPLVMGPYVPDEPDRVVVITPTSGPGYVMEAAADAGAFQARVRGPQGGDGSPGAQAAAEQLAYALDALILGASFPAVVDGHTLIHVHRLGSTPSPLSGEPDDGDRFSYVTSYVCIAGT
jgi:hypothetical protein